jgi:chondroitin AC lyase
MKKYYFLFLSVLIIPQLLSFASTPGDFEIIMERIHKDYQNTPNTATLDQNVKELLNSILPIGAWLDINYSDNSQTNWSPDTHLKRLGSLVKAYTRSSSIFFEDESLYDIIIQSMQYWTNLSPEPKSSNWWYKSISVPQEIGRILISMRFSKKNINQQLEEKMIRWMDKSVPINTSPGKDGSNLTDICQHMIMRACLIQDSDLLSFAVSQSTNSIFITTGEGIQSDYSFRAHGPQLYIYGYGREYLSGVRNIAVYTANTEYAIAPEKTAIISDFTRKGFIKTARGAYSDFNAFGRGISRADATRTDVDLVEQIKSFDLEIHQDEYELAIKGMRGQVPLESSVNPDNTQFWRSDYTVHHRPKYLFSVNSVSSRTVKTEMGNGENIKGHYLADGSNFIAVTGDEYYNIFPVWDWNKIPGITIPEDENYPQRPSWGFNYGKTAFVGGVSDGLYGVSTYQMNDYQTTAKKSWFFFDDEVVALGSGVNSTSLQTLNTSVNQSHLKGPVITSINQQEQTLSSGVHQFNNNLDWVWHSKIGYIFPDHQNLKLSNQIQSGSWNAINKSQSSETINSEVFKLWIDHGKQPNNAKYAYIVVPGVENPSEMADYDTQKIQILSNNDSIQAIRHLDLDIVQAVFHQAGTLLFGNFELKVSHPCVLILKSIDNQSVKVTASDPTQLLQNNLRIGFRFPGMDRFKIANLKLPEGDLAGSSVSSIIDMDSPDFGNF